MSSVVGLSIHSSDLLNPALGPGLLLRANVGLILPCGPGVVQYVHLGSGLEEIGDGSGQADGDPRAIEGEQPVALGVCVLQGGALSLASLNSSPCKQS